MTFIDWAIFFVYLAATAGIGFWAGRNQKTTEDYFLGARRIPWWAAMLSLVATETSAVTVVAIPAQMYAVGGDFGFLQCALGFAVGKILISVFILPRYFEGNLTTPYEFLGARLGKIGEHLGAFLFMAALFVGAAFRVYVGAIPIRTAAGLSLDVSLFIIALLAIAYTLFGGLRAVIYTDVFQMLLFLGGGVLTFLCILGELPENWYTLWTEAAAMGKTGWFDWGFRATEGGGWHYDWSQPHTIFAGLIGAVFVTLATHGTDHSNIQRLLACQSLAKARLALIVSAIVVFFQFFLFLLVGLAVAVYFKVLGNPPEVSGNAILPFFIVHYLPTGLAGLLIAGIFAAAMSTVDSALSALSATTVKNWGVSEEEGAAKALAKARWVVLAWGLLLWVGAEGASHLGKEKLIDTIFAASNSLYGPLLGLFLIALFLIPRGGMMERKATGSLLLSLGIGLSLQAVVFVSGQGWWGTESAPLFSLAWPWVTLVGALATFLPACVWVRRS